MFCFVWFSEDHFIQTFDEFSLLRPSRFFYGTATLLSWFFCGSFVVLPRFFRGSSFMTHTMLEES